MVHPLWRWIWPVAAGTWCERRELGDPNWLRHGLFRACTEHAPSHYCPCPAARASADLSNSTPLGPLALDLCLTGTCATSPCARQHTQARKILCDAIRQLGIRRMILQPSFSHETAPTFLRSINKDTLPCCTCNQFRSRTGRSGPPADFVQPLAQERTIVTTCYHVLILGSGCLHSCNIN